MEETVLLQRIDPAAKAFRWYKLTLTAEPSRRLFPAVTINRGRIGEEGQTIDRVFDSAESARNYFRQKIEEKIARGYQVVDSVSPLVERECVLCDLVTNICKEPRFIYEFPNSLLFLNLDQTYLGRSILLFKKHLPDFFRLAPSELLASLSEIRHSEKAIRQALAPQLMNYLFMGNKAGHVHLHLVPRYATDPRFGESPFLETARTERAQWPKEQYCELAERIKSELQRMKGP